MYKVKCILTALWSKALYEKLNLCSKNNCSIAPFIQALLSKRNCKQLGKKQPCSWLRLGKVWFKFNLNEKQNWWCLVKIISYKSERMSCVLVKIKTKIQKKTLRCEHCPSGQGSTEVIRIRCKKNTCGALLGMIEKHQGGSRCSFKWRSNLQHREV